MAKRHTARPVSGELMASGLAPPRPGGLRPAEDVLDADYEVVVRAAPAGRAESAATGFSDNLGSGRFDFLSGKDPQRGTLFSARGGLMFWACGTALAAAAFWVSGGHAVVMAALPNPAPDAPSAITMGDVISRVDFSGAKPVIFVDGQLSNDGRVAARLPGLEIRVADLHGLVTRYKLGTSSRNLGAGEQYAFSSRLDVPKNGVKTVSVTFAE